MLSTHQSIFRRTCNLEEYGFAAHSVTLLLTFCAQFHWYIETRFPRVNYGHGLVLDIHGSLHFRKRFC